MKPTADAMRVQDGWRCLGGAEALDSHWTGWLAAARLLQAAAVAWPAWVRAAALAYPDYAARLRVYGRFEDGTLRDVISLTHERFVAGNRLVSGCNSTWPHFAACIGTVDSVAELIPMLLKEVAVVVWEPILPDGALWQAVSSWPGRGNVRTYTSSDDTVLELDRGYGELESQLAPNLQRDLRQGEKRLRGMGQLGFEVVAEQAAVAKILHEFLDLENRGWKGQAGSSILGDPASRIFYGELAQRAALDGSLRLYTLRLAGHLIAAEFTVHNTRRLEVLKIAYDESLAKASPGTVLRAMILRQLADEGAILHYCLGRSSPWKLRWCRNPRPLHTAMISRNRLAGALAFATGQRVRQGIRNRVLKLRGRR